VQTCELTDRNVIQGQVTGQGSTTCQNPRSRWYGKWRGCTRGIHVLIRGGLFNWRLLYRQCPVWQHSEKDRGQVLQSNILWAANLLARRNSGDGACGHAAGEVKVMKNFFGNNNFVPFFYVLLNCQQVYPVRYAQCWYPRTSRTRSI